MAQAGADYELPTERLNMTGAAQTVTLADNTEYRFANALSALTINFPQGNFSVWLRFTAGSGFSLTMPNGATYIGGAPTWETGAQYEMSVKDGTSIIAKVEAAV